MSSQQAKAFLPTRVEHYRRHARGDLQTAENYRGIPIHAFRGLHNRVHALLAERGLLTPGASAVDLGAGGGSMSQRLADAGLMVTALDAVPENFRATGANVAVHPADLNSDFASAVDASADLVAAVEITEHIENPRHFLRTAASLLRPGGTLLLTTPNVDSTFALVELALKGSFTRFGGDYYRNDGHITPVTAGQILEAAQEAGLELVYRSSHGHDTINFREWPRFWLLYQIARRLRRIPPDRDGAIGIYLFRRKS